MEKVALFVFSFKTGYLTVVTFPHYYCGHAVQLVGKVWSAPSRNWASQESSSVLVLGYDLSREYNSFLRCGK